MPKPTESTPISVTEQAQRKRHQVISFTKEGIPGKVIFPSDQFRQAFAASEEMRKGMDENQMGILMYSDHFKGGEVIAVKIFPRLAGDVDLMNLIGNEKELINFLSRRYKDMYLAIQEYNPKQASLLFEQTLAPLGISREATTGELPNICLGYDPRSPQRQTFEQVQETAKSILRNNLPTESSTSTLTMDEASRFILGIWRLIGTINPDSQQDLNNSYPYQTLLPNLAGTHNFDSGSF